MDALRNSLSDYIDWIKAFHVIAVIAWMSGMLYLPRLFVYHTQSKVGSESSERFKVMEYRLLKQIINPAMIASTHHCRVLRCSRVSCQYQRNSATENAE